MKTVVVIPMKDPSESKTRLAATMQASDRERMSLALFQRAQVFFSSQFPQFERLVVTASPVIASLARGCGSRVLDEAGACGLNSAARSGLDWARQGGYDRLLVVPADIPVWLAGEVDEMLHEGASNAVVIALAHDGGTNALLIDLKRVGAFDFRYGADSARRHVAAARDQGAIVVARTWPFLSHDIDTVDDCLLLSQKLTSLANAE